MKCKLMKQNYSMKITQSYVPSHTYQHNPISPKERSQILCDCTYLHLMGLL